MTTSEQTLEELRSKIKKEKRSVDIKPFSHNIIGWTLCEIAKRFGGHEANKAIRDFGLEKLGWKEE